MNPWEEIQRRIKTIIDRQTYNKWFSRTKFLSYRGKCLKVAAADLLSKEWIQSNFHPLIEECAKEILGEEIQIEIDVQKKEEASGESSSPWNGTINPVLTFDNFVVGRSNKLAHNAALAVSTQPSAKHNPLFIYGSSGVGKTHLMHATANRIKALHPRLKRVYISSENFMNEMVDSIKNNVTFEFRKRYRGTDVLFIDDIHFIAGKEKTKEELFHTLSNLIDNGKQVVVTSHFAPKDMPSIGDSLGSRLGCGLVADIQKPDNDTTRSIIEMKARESDMVLDEESIRYLSSKLSSNVRYLQGCLNKMLAISSLQETVLDLDVAKRVVNELIKTHTENLSIDGIQKLVAGFLKVSVYELKSKDHSRRVTLPRQIAMYLCKKVANKSYPEIGRKFGGKHHSTVIHAVNKIERCREEDKSFNTMINNLIDALK